MVDCTHTVTQDKEGEKHGDSFCVDCGIKVYELDERPCSDCKHFKDMGAFSIPICRKHLMGVSHDMHVWYKIEKGTCFKEPELPKE